MANKKNQDNQQDQQDQDNQQNLNINKDIQENENKITKSEFEADLEKQIIDECIKLTEVRTSTARDIIFLTRDLLKYRSKKKQASI